MNRIKTEYETRKEDIDKYVKLIKDISNRNGQLIFIEEDNKTENIPPDVLAILKSSLVLCCYNCVESTITNCLEKIIQTIESEKCKYNKLNESIKETFVNSFVGRLSSDKQSSSIQGKGKVIKDIIDFIVFNKEIHIALKDLMNSSSGGNYSGSLDTRAITKIFNKFGIDLHDYKCNELQSIKNYRNQLGHGERSFNDCCRTVTIQQIDASKNKMFEYLETLINKVEDFINQKKYENPD